MEYGILWPVTWLFIFVEWIVDVWMIATLFRPKSGILNVFRGMNIIEMPLNFLSFIIIGGDPNLTSFDQFLITSASYTFLILATVIL